jgi:hypothetical protein
VAHETIYHTLFIRARALKRELLMDLRRAGSVRRLKGRMPATGRSVMPCVDSRAPTGGEDRAGSRSREGDLLAWAAPSRASRDAETSSPYFSRRRDVDRPDAGVSETSNLLLCPTDQAMGHS